MPRTPKTNKKRTVKSWIFTDARRESMKRAQRVHAILVNIGKKYRDKEARKFRV
jgi:hypothetical protein